jgi:glutathionylspermidine synthase
VSLPWTCGPALSPADHADVIRRAIFECCKWHTQADDRPILCPFPLLLASGMWEEVASLAEALARETLTAEAELRSRRELHAVLGLPRPLLRCLRHAARRKEEINDLRVIRFDFHWTDQGWRISEANTDVAGGYIEASGVTALVAGHYPGFQPAGDPAGVLAESLLKRGGAGAQIGLMHLTEYTEDRQIMLYLARRFEERGLLPCLFGPTQMRWSGGQAGMACDWYSGPLDVLFRFFPAEWLPRLPGRTGWENVFVGGRTPICNPGVAVLSQSKRFSLVWDRLRTPLSNWRALLPETRSPDQADGPPDLWVLKPALGHEGKDIAIAGVTEAATWERINREARRKPALWAAQRRFETVPLPTPDGSLYPCLGVYVIDGRAAGAFGRVGLRPLIDDRSLEIAVLTPSSPNE